MEQTLQVKPDEEYPLLKVEAGGGDGKIRNSVTTNNVTAGWNVRYTPKQSCCNRWPEFVSSFWMTLILLTISFLVFYALGMSVYIRQPIVVVRYNATKPESDVFYHHIIQRDAYVPFSIFSDYLSYMARQYPAIRFSIYFLIDDSCNPFHGPRNLNNRVLNKFVPHVTSPFSSVFNQKRDIKDFQKRYQNVNIFVISLSKYMAMTPLKYKWKMIPRNHLSFYGRIHEVQQNGGIGLDLISFNNQFNNNIKLDKRIDDVLRNYNNGIEPEKYQNIINSLEDEQSFSIFSNLIKDFFTDTFSFFDKDWNTNITIQDSNPKIRTHRSKREVQDDSARFNLTNKNNSLIYNDTMFSHNINMSTNNSILLHNKTSANTSLLSIPNNIESRNDLPTSHLPFYNDFISRFFGDVGPTYLIPKPIFQSDLVSYKVLNEKHFEDDRKISNLLLISPEGHFVATSLRLHPFLTQLLHSSCYRLNPTSAIKDARITQCSGFLRDDIYCENIRVIYNAI